MSDAFRTQSGKVGFRPASYEAFGGLDTSRPAINMDTPRNLHLTELQNAYVDWRGQIVTDPGARLLTRSPRVRHIRFFSDQDYCTVQQDQSGSFNLSSSLNHTLLGAYPNTANPTTALFNRRVHFFASGQPAYIYDNAVFRPASNAVNLLRASFAATVGRRLAISGIPSNPTNIELTRVDNLVVSTEERPDDTNVLRAGQIDVKNLLARNDRITGLSPFEQDRLIIFAQDQALMYRIGANRDEWTLDERANIKVGALSHNSIVEAGVDVIFASRAGVNHIQRSPDNGILVYSRSLSDKIEILYRKLVRSVPDPAMISAAFDQDEGRYYLFFPQRNGVFSQFLSLSLNPEEGDIRPSWSAGTFLNPTCADFLGGRLLFGGADGVYEIMKFADLATVRPEATIVTPYLWHGDILSTKDTHSLVVQAAGQGALDIEAWSSDGKLIWSNTVEIDGADDGKFEDVPLFQSFEMKFEQRYRGVRFKFSIRGEEQIRLFGFAIMHRS